MSHFLPELNFWEGPVPATLPFHLWNGQLQEVTGVMGDFGFQPRGTRADSESGQ